MWHGRQYGSVMTGAVLTALLAAAPLTAGAADMTDKAKSTTEEAKTAVGDSWITTVAGAGAGTTFSVFSSDR